MSEWNFADVWEALARCQPDAECLVQGEQRLSWEDFDQRAQAVAAALVACGLGYQAKVAQLLYNCPEYLESVFACFKAGLVPVNTNFRYQHEELAQLWEDADVEAVIFHASLSERVARLQNRRTSPALWLCVDDTGGEVPPWAIPYESLAAISEANETSLVKRRSPDDLILLYTGGTTGRPKGVMWRQDDVFAIQNRTGGVRYPEQGWANAMPQLLAERRRPPSRLVPCPPLVHGTGAFSAYSVLNAGGTVILLKGRHFDAEELLDTIERERVTQLALVGDAFCRPIVAALDAHPGRWTLSSLNRVVSSGMVWSERVRADLLRHLPKLLCVDILGSSEAIGVAYARTRSEDVSADDEGRGGVTFRLGADTRVVGPDGVEVTPGSGRAGLLMLRGRMPLGYYKDPGATEATFREIDGERWSVPGDYVSVDEDGAARLLGRGSLVINTGGEKVFVEEVEEALRFDPAVGDAAVVGLPDERMGEIVVAAVSVVPSRTLDLEGLERRLRSRLATYKVPKRIEVLESVERGPTGKVDYPLLRATLKARATGSTSTRDVERCEG